MWCRVQRLDGTLPVVKELLPHYLEESVKVPILILLLCYDFVDEIFGHIT